MICLAESGIDQSKVPPALKKIRDDFLAKANPTQKSVKLLMQTFHLALEERGKKIKQEGGKDLSEIIDAIKPGCAFEKYLGEFFLPAEKFVLLNQLLDRYGIAHDYEELEDKDSTTFRLTIEDAKKLVETVSAPLALLEGTQDYHALLATEEEFENALSVETAAKIARALSSKNDTEFLEAPQARNGKCIIFAMNFSVISKILINFAQMTICLLKLKSALLL